MTNGLVYTVHSICVSHILHYRRFVESKISSYCEFIYYIYLSRVYFHFEICFAFVSLSPKMIKLWFRFKAYSKYEFILTYVCFVDIQTFNAYMQCCVYFNSVYQWYSTTCVRANLLNRNRRENKSRFWTLEPKQTCRNVPAVSVSIWLHDGESLLMAENGALQAHALELKSNVLRRKFNSYTLLSVFSKEINPCVIDFVVQKGIFSRFTFDKRFSALWAI